MKKENRRAVFEGKIVWHKNIETEKGLYTLIVKKRGRSAFLMKFLNGKLVEIVKFDPGKILNKYNTYFSNDKELAVHFKWAHDELTIIEYENRNIVAHSVIRSDENLGG